MRAAGDSPGKGMIPGWNKVLQLMPVGSRSKIGPNVTLIFEVELLSIEEGKEKP